MNLPSPAEIFDALAVVTVFVLLLAGMAWLADRKKDAPVKQPPRAYRPDGNYRQPTDDWRDPVRPFFEAHVGPATRANAEAIRDGFLDRNRLIKTNSGNRAAVTAGSPDTRNGDSPCHEAA